MMKHTNKKIEQHHKRKAQKVLWCIRNLPNATKVFIQGVRNIGLYIRRRDK